MRFVTLSSPHAGGSVRHTVIEDGEVEFELGDPTAEVHRAACGVRIDGLSEVKGAPIRKPIRDCSLCRDAMTARIAAVDKGNTE